MRQRFLLSSIFSVKLLLNRDKKVDCEQPSSPTVFEEKRDCWQSNEKAVEAADFRTRTPSQSHVEVRVMSMRMFATVINPLGTPMKLKNTKIMCSICHEREKKTTYNGVFEVSSILS